MEKLCHQIPELQALESRDRIVRIPPELDVPVTERVRRLIDTAAFRRLAKISQLGLVSMVYPGATHSRFEHSLGVYSMALRYLRQLAATPRFDASVTGEQAECFLVAALLHDLGHWPFCHPLEDIRDPRIPRHEALAREMLTGEVAGLLRDDWGVEPEQIDELLCGSPVEAGSQLLSSLLSGPIDIDKLDYLRRDSLHAGVPYGHNFDHSRLVASLCLNASATALAISEKGRTAAEMMVFARYVMFSEVYWHHTVRSATAMLQRGFFELLDQLPVEQLYRQSEQEFIECFLSAAKGTVVESHVEGLFGKQRRLFKRLAQYSLYQHPDVFARLARRPYPWLVQLTHHLAEELSNAAGVRVAPEQVLIDAPPVKREVEIAIDVYFPKEDRYRRLADVSPVVRTLAEQQFDDIVKRVRIFADPSLVKAIPNSVDLETLLHQAIDQVSDQPDASDG